MKQVAIYLVTMVLGLVLVAGPVLAFEDVERPLKRAEVPALMMTK